MWVNISRMAFFFFFPSSPFPLHTICLTSYSKRMATTLHLTAAIRSRLKVAVKGLSINRSGALSLIFVQLELAWKGKLHGNKALNRTRTIGVFFSGVEGFLQNFVAPKHISLLFGNTTKCYFYYHDEDDDDEKLMCHRKKKEKCPCISDSNHFVKIRASLYLKRDYFASDSSTALLFSPNISTRLRHRRSFTALTDHLLFSERRPWDYSQNAWVEINRPQAFSYQRSVVKSIRIHPSPLLPTPSIYFMTHFGLKLKRSQARLQHFDCLIIIIIMLVLLKTR